MDPEREGRVEALYRAVANHNPATRRAYLASICKDDESLRLEVERLIERRALEDCAERATSETATAVPAHGVTAPSPSQFKPDAPETFMAGRFSVRRLIGAGGMGRVYEVFDNTRQMRVAMKTFRKSDSTALYLFKQEFRSLADVAHPNLVTLYELFSENQQLFFTMQFVDGVDFLSHVWTRPGDDDATGGS